MLASTGFAVGLLPPLRPEPVAAYSYAAARAGTVA